MAPLSCSNQKSRLCALNPIHPPTSPLERHTEPQLSVAATTFRCQTGHTGLSVPTWSYTSSLHLAVRASLGKFRPDQSLSCVKPPSLPVALGIKSELLSYPLQLYFILSPCLYQVSAMLPPSGPATFLAPFCPGDLSVMSPSCPLDSWLAPDHHSHLSLNGIPLE